jgi:hypothetical protein
MLAADSRRYAPEYMIAKNTQHSKILNMEVKKQWKKPLRVLVLQKYRDGQNLAKSRARKMLY